MLLGQMMWVMELLWILLSSLWGDGEIKLPESDGSSDEDDHLDDNSQVQERAIVVVGNDSGAEILAMEDDVGVSNTANANSVLQKTL